MVQRYVGMIHECLTTIQRRISKLIPSLRYIINEGLRNIRGLIIRDITRKYNKVRPADIRREKISERHDLAEDITRQTNLETAC